MVHGRELTYPQEGTPCGSRNDCAASLKWMPLSVTPTTGLARLPLMDTNVCSLVATRSPAGAPVPLCHMYSRAVSLL